MNVLERASLQSRSAKASLIVGTMARVPPLSCLIVLPLITLYAISHVNATIFVPEEIPSLLSVVYSNMPPIKKGTDSKLGVGFRLGPNADVQFQLELGPQTNTLPIGGAASAPAVANKRHATVGQGSGLSGGKPKDWLNAWRLQMSPGYVADESNNAVSGEVAGGSVGDGDGSSDAVAHLRQLYKPQPIAA
ncbi:uncharacterized protein LOC114124606 [Aphis gossypii]|uniref:uncharacterized protein LOC114124606 n=1 Tax=Aphis gossypii TaxID=80765 RepID=UPI002159A1B6|nr:uncharacterized protein LOC114124606 [Aphis gossypii]